MLSCSDEAARLDQHHALPYSTLRPGILILFHTSTCLLLLVARFGSSIIIYILVRAANRLPGPNRKRVCLAASRVGHVYLAHVAAVAIIVIASENALLQACIYIPRTIALS